MNDRVRFIRALFDAGEGVCLSSSVFGTFVSDLDRPTFIGKHDQYVALNPLKKGTKRLDENVTAYRNFLVEFDKIDLDAQRALIETIPCTTVVFSGKKSLHAIISLKTPLASREEYRKMTKRIFAKLPDADKANSNPSRFTRMGGAERGDNGAEQTLYKLRDRISIEELEAWLGPAPIEEVQDIGELPPPTGLNKWTRFFLDFGSEPGHFNADLFKAACDMSRNNYTKEQAIEMLTGVTGHLDKSDLRTISSAFKGKR